MARTAADVGLALPKAWSAPMKKGWRDTVDVVRSSAGGVLKGAVELAGATGNAQRMVNLGLIDAGERLGVLSSAQAAQERRLEPLTRRAAPNFGMPTYTSDDVRHSLPSPVKQVESYHPRTLAGRYAHTVGEFAPNALTPGGVPLKAAAVVPGVISEAAGQLTAGTDWEPVARLAGGMVVVGGMHGIAAPARGRVFWTGGTPAKNAAANWAAERGGMTLEQTVPGKALVAADNLLRPAIGKERAYAG